MQTNLESRVDARLHVAAIMDGNGRWATRQGLPRTAGHRAGVEAVRRVVEAAPDLGIGVLTLFAFSADNWRRPRPEVQALMRLLRGYLRSETRRLLGGGTPIHLAKKPFQVLLYLIENRDRLVARRELLDWWDWSGAERDFKRALELNPTTPQRASGTPSS